uniref:tRNA dimethylallyltransferase n=1 Tax=uncultured Nocardioidaceae bacterium TaxID=253824 RepID=A0A6J4KZ57_9ACTN|nr:MAG: tRNA dimethylallyltransferase [uncultured Nocardioidaceae bacterium]
MSRSVVAVVGPTASGKSDLAVSLAQAVGGEIINADSMQLYRGMDVGTAKLSPEQRRGVPHHLLDVLDVTETASVAQFQTWARNAVTDCHVRAVVPILVGGSALYVRAVLDRFEFPGTDARLRVRLENELALLGPVALHDRLRAADPLAASQILAGNVRRIVRALEVIELTGKPFVASLPAYDYVHAPVLQLGLDVPREVLDERIEARVKRMWADGLVDEVRRLERVGLRDGRTASRALGYAQVLRVLTGELSEQEARDQTAAGTRRFVRKQDAWFRKDHRIHWLPYDAPDLLERAMRLLEGSDATIASRVQASHSGQ